MHLEAKRSTTINTEELSHDATVWCIRAYLLLLE